MEAAFILSSLFSAFPTGFTKTAENIFNYFTEIMQKNDLNEDDTRKIAVVTDEGANIKTLLDREKIFSRYPPLIIVTSVQKNESRGCNCNMFHSSQQSSAMLNESRQQNLLCFEQMRQFMSCNYRFQMTGATLPRPSLPRTIKMTMEVQNNDFASLVTICGEFPSIDEAQRRIRNLSPITIAISLKCVKTALARSVAAGKSLSSFVMDWCAPQGKLSRFGRIHFNVAQAPNWYSRSVGKDPFLIIRGSYSDREEILKASKEACILLFDLAVKNEFCARLEIPVLQRRWVVGSPDGVLMRTISTMSGATIHFPVSSKGLTPTSYYITGCAESCLEAVRMFYAVSPVRLDFEVDNLHLNKQIPSEKSREFDCFDTKHNVIISMRKSQYEGGFRLENEKMRHSVSLMTSEENLNNMYAVRRVLLKDKMYRAEKAPSNRRAGRPCFIDYLRVLVAEAAPPEKNSKQNF
uniref:GLD-3 KH5 domain-containing protein n=1 Tax=Ditylenchus dipsaci TaxID=166011 RepID=A0A915E208_9BILA